MVERIHCKKLILGMELARKPRSTQRKPSSCKCELVPLAESLETKVTTETMMDMARVVEEGTIQGLVEQVPQEHEPDWRGQA
eukprot:5743974-Amphidinium_carterae.1